MEMIKKTKYRLSFGRPNQKLWEEGWVVQVYKSFGLFLILRYTKHFKK